MDHHRIRSLLTHNRLLDETVKGLRDLIKQKKTLVFYGTFGWFRVYVPVYSMYNREMITLQELSSLVDKGMADAKSARTEAYAIANPAEIKSKAIEATKSLIAMGFKKQHIVTVITPITLVNAVTGGGTGGYYDRKNHIVAIRPDQVHIINTWTHEWAHAKMLGGVTTKEMKQVVQDVYDSIILKSKFLDRFEKKLIDEFPPAFASRVVTSYNSWVERKFPGYELRLGHYQDHIANSRANDRPPQPSTVYHSELRMEDTVDKVIDNLRQNRWDYSILITLGWNGMAGNLSFIRSWIKYVKENASALEVTPEWKFYDIIEELARNNIKSGFIKGLVKYPVNSLTSELNNLRDEMAKAGELPSGYAGGNYLEFFAELVARAIDGTLPSALKPTFKALAAKIQ